MHIKVDQDRCAGCEVCVSLCPYGAIEMKEGRAVISELCQACGICLSQCPDGAIVEEKQRIEAKAEEANGVWVFAEQRHGKASPVSYELLGAGRRLADTLNTELSAVFFGYGIREQARELIAFGADKVYLSDDPVFERFQDEPYTEMLSRIIEQYMPEIVIAGATAIGRSFFPRVAARLRAGLTADCTALEIDEEKRMLLQIRPAFGGNIMATIMCPNKRPQMATVRPRVMKADKRDDSKKGVIIEVSPPHLKVRAKAVEFIKEVTTTVNLQEADVIVAGGRGLGDARNFNMLFELAEVFGGADSHTCTYGALGAFSTGVGSTDVASAMATGECWFKVPESMKFIYYGKLKKWVGGKDLILYTIGDIGVDGAIYRAMEFTGETIKDLPMHGRLTMCNMAIEAGGKNGIIVPDDITENYVKNRAKRPYKFYASDNDASYTEVKEYDCSGIEPVVACPHLPSNVKFAKELSNITIDQVVIGSCTNGRIEDLRQAAEVIKGKKVNPNVRMIVIPATQRVYMEAVKEGLIEIFVEAEAVVSTPTCGPCLGGHMGILAKGERAIATTNRNFVGRMGHPESEVYLSNPAIAAATAVLGRIGLPEEIGL